MTARRRQPADAAAPANRRRALRRLAGALASAPIFLAAAPAGPQDHPPALTVGLPPFLSAGALLEMVRPLREHLERSLGRPVAFYGARDFRTLYAAVQAGDYDLAVLPAHVAAVAIADWRFAPLVSMQDDTTLRMMVRKDGPLQHVAQLRGQRIGMLEPSSLTALIGRQWLRSLQLEPGRDLTVVTQPAVNSGLMALERGDIDALLMANFQVEAMHGAASARLRELAQGPAMPAPLLLASPRLSAGEVAALLHALLSFKSEQPSTGAFGNPLRPPSPERLRRIEMLLEPARALLH